MSNPVSIDTSAYEKIAQICHEVNRAYCHSIGDDSQPSWEDAPQWQRDSAVAGVKFHLENETTPEASHVSWMAQKLADGWVYGDVKDPEKKTHPCMVPYDELPLEQRTKDYLFKAICDVHKSRLVRKDTSGGLSLTVNVTGTEPFKRLVMLVHDIYSTTSDDAARDKIAEFLSMRTDAPQQEVTLN